MTYFMTQAVRIVFIVCLSALATLSNAQQLGVAGSPVGTIQDRNYERLFTQLRQNGINNYFPTFQFEEVPKPRSLGYEADFVTPCSADDPAFQALRKTGMKLIVPGELVYPDARKLKGRADAGDPLLALIACAGREQIAAITNYDEAAFHGIALGNVQKFYQQVKAVDPSLPVLMVHGPIILDKPEFRSQELIDNYLAMVQAYSANADIVGFDVYPVPAFLAKVATPFSGQQPVTAQQAVAEYMSWLNQTVPDKEKLMVLQGFAYSDLYQTSYLEANVPSELRAMVNAPDQGEMAMMLKQARDAGAKLVVWWGPSALNNANSAPWPTILSLGRQHGK